MKVPDWLLCGSEPDAVQSEANWSELPTKNESLNRSFWLKSRVGVCLEALAQTVPEYTDGPPSVPQEDLTWGVEG